MAARRRWLALLLPLALLANCGDLDTIDTGAPDELPSASSTSTQSSRATPPSPAGAQGENASPPSPTSPARSGDLEVHFLDVGQGDSTVLIGNGVTVLIDAGRHDRADVVPALRSIGVEHIDVVIITHAHADHIGQLDTVLDAFPVDEVWMSGTPHTTATFERALTAIERSGAAYGEPRSGDVVVLGDLRVEVLNPERLVGDQHADGVVVRVRHGEVRFLFTGDAEAPTETAMVRRHGADLRADIYQVGHHGSRTSSNSDFLGAVQPTVAIYSASTGNSYGHPHEEAIQRLVAAGSEIYGTATHGTVTVRSDGASWTVDTARTEVPVPVSTATAPARAPPTSTDQSDTAACGPDQVDMNTANHDELQRIIHIGPARAHDIERLRPFSSVDALTRINGIGPARIADIKAEGIACARAN